MDTEPVFDLNRPRERPPPAPSHYAEDPIRLPKLRSARITVAALALLAGGLVGALVFLAAPTASTPAPFYMEPPESPTFAPVQASASVVAPRPATTAARAIRGEKHAPAATTPKKSGPVAARAPIAKPPPVVKKRNATPRK